MNASTPRPVQAKLSWPVAIILITLVFFSFSEIASGFAAISVLQSVVQQCASVRIAEPIDYALAFEHRNLLDVAEASSTRRACAPRAAARTIAAILRPATRELAHERAHFARKRRAHA
jgi:hypothetical protein